jgi:class 3 adenylate cyclase
MPTQASAGAVALVSSILVSAVASIIKELAAGKRFLFADQGDVALRGFEDPVRLYELRWREEGA